MSGKKEFVIRKESVNEFIETKLAGASTYRQNFPNAMVWGQEKIYVKENAFPIGITVSFQVEDKGHMTGQPMLANIRYRVEEYDDLCSVLVKI